MLLWVRRGRGSSFGTLEGKCGTQRVVSHLGRKLLVQEWSYYIYPLSQGVEIHWKVLSFWHR